MESGQRNHDDNFKLQIYLKITQLQLEVDDSGNISLFLSHKKTTKSTVVQTRDST